MRFRFLWVGKTKDRRWRALQEEYLGRLSHFVRFEVIEVKAGGGAEVESKRIGEKANPSAFLCLLDVAGTALTSEGLSNEIVRWQNNGTKEVCFVIGGENGVDDAVRERADLVLSLSALTFTHEMARVVLAEQLYRAFSIIKGFPYQR